MGYLSQNGPRYKTRTLDEFDELLLQVMDDVIRASLGDRSARMIFAHLERMLGSRTKIPSNLDAFSLELRKILSDTGPRFSLSKGISAWGTAALIERTIAKWVCKKLGIPFTAVGPIDFSFFMKDLKDLYKEKLPESDSLPKKEVSV